MRRSVSGDYPPLYQAAYMLGGLQMQALYEEAVRGGGGLSPKQFHDAVLHEVSATTRPSHCASL